MKHRLFVATCQREFASTIQNFWQKLKRSRSKGNQTTKFGQLTEYNMRNIFLEKLCTKRGKETIPRFFHKK